jgi:integrase/recombinase XerC
MSVAGMDVALSRAEFARMLREAVKDKSFQASPVGTMVGRYIRWLRNEWGATPRTVTDYESVLARMCLALADREPYEVSIEDLRAVIDLWAGQTARTRQKVTSVIRSFWGWMEEQGHIAISPAAKIRRPRAERRVARILPADGHGRLLHAAKEPRDRLALFCLLDLGVRKEELNNVRFRDFDPSRGWLRVYGKGRKERVLPLRGPILAELGLCLSVDLPHAGRPPRPDDYLLYPAPRRAMGKQSDGVTIKTGRVADPRKQMSPVSVHRWWYGIAQAAGLVAPGVTAGLNMHQARHTFAMELRRVAGIEAASQALGHADLSTTLGIYGHQDASDLERAMERYAEWREQEACDD